MSTNISKQKREDLLNKIKEIRNFISAAPQDENTGNLLSYLCNLERDVNGKKYGLVFEEHREEIDDILDTYTPVLTGTECCCSMRRVLLTELWRKDCFPFFPIPIWR